MKAYIERTMLASNDNSMYNLRIETKVGKAKTPQRTYVWLATPAPLVLDNLILIKGDEININIPDLPKPIKKTSADGRTYYAIDSIIDWSDVSSIEMAKPFPGLRQPPQPKPTVATAAGI